ncbi:transglycosylase SLT domain-containing protein [Alphaproteobacteria bacterium GH1-50]|uniref:Transglycosylase SLT domain-containing protein n=1 Tax=Kangsaoukella pontilimi TaxID=2691042 RepID=A0A7C9IPT5_9RHOB|nr:lytic transglycosylase domain-containing protein [Kangsaoukella pontilimi]MXQ08390.1 transglycosylase SLT domain-containing protein [Kangsaoukella pontilimi]
MIKALASALFLCLFSGMSAAQTSPEVDLFERSLDRLRAGDWREALILGESAGAVARDVVEWHRLRAGLGDFDAVQSFVERRADWPGLRLLRRESEEAVPIAARPEEVLAFFADTPPQTGAGELALIEAYRALGQPSDAEAEAVRAWLTAILSEADESAILARYGEALQPHHIARLDMLLWRNARQAAERMYPRVPEAQRALARARLALRADADGVDALIDAVPAPLADDPGLAFERMQWRARKGRNDDAIALMLERNGSELGQAESWAGWRRAFVRTEMRAGRADVAYRLASAHGLADGSSFADLEWLSGYIALTYLNRADTALDHFRRFRASVASPISLGRAGYWEGRAHEALGDVENARLAYAFGGEYQTSFYGLLAAEKAGIPLDPMLTGRETFPNWRLTSFAESSVFEAARLFIAAGERNLAEQFLTHLAESLNEDELGSLGAYLDREGEPHLALMVAKMGAQRGRVIPAAYFPVVDLDIGQLPVPGELALAIARRESEFDPVVTSGAGARGLMQVMPATARAVAAELEIDYDGRRLLNDPVYNARIGTAYLDELMEVFDGNPVMVAAGYNAGPGRPFRWMTERGDPRRGQMDMIDWIEHIPFNETRNYVMRVTESLPVYRARLTGEVGPIRFSEELRAMPGHERQAIKGELIRPRARPAILTD